MKFEKLFGGKVLEFNVLTKTLPTKGNIVYEYNPLRNYRLTKSMYEYKNLLYTKEELETKFGITMKNSDKEWDNVPAVESDPILREAGELVDFDTDELKVSLNHPVQIIPLYSYDGSVNLIINDGINIPRLINSRFSATGKNTYEIVDRKGNNDTNIYDQGSQFDIDTSLYKRVTTIPKIEFKEVQPGGNLKVGNYHFYFKLSDADGNETDFIGESGVVSVFIGFDTYHSVHTGQKNENSYKLVVFCLSNLDSAYSYVTVYYSRNSSENNENSITEYAKLNKKYLINNAGISNINITGNEGLEFVTVSDINTFYNTVDSATTLAVCLNMLFLANVHKPDIPYDELSDLSLRFLPYLHEESYNVELTEDYYLNTNNVGYIDPKYIYDKTGYWTEEIYRLGIVYILPNGTLSPVFNIRGAYNIDTFDNFKYSNKPVFENNERLYIDYDESTYYVINSDTNRENVKGVIQFKPKHDLKSIFGIDIRVDDVTIQELKKYVKGYFFVRLPRIPTILAQGITIGIDLESRTPTIPTAGELLTKSTYNNTHVTTDDINDVNYISEGFLSRYSFYYKEQENSFWEDFGKAMAIGVGVIAAAAATVFTMGVAAPAIIGIGMLVAAAGTAVVIGGKEIHDEIVLAANKGIYRKKQQLDGRSTKPLKGYDLAENDNSRVLTSDFVDRIIIKPPSKNKVQAIVCPDYEVNQEFYNQIFTGNKHLIRSIDSLSINSENGFSYNYFSNSNRHFYIPSYHETTDVIQGEFNVIGVPDGVKAVGLNDLIFRSKAGEAEEAFRYEQVGQKFKDESMTINLDEEGNSKVSLKKINSDIIRGMFGAYVAFNDMNDLFGPARTVNIYIPNYSVSNMNNYFNIRMLDSSSYNSISERFDINEETKEITLSGTKNLAKQYTLFRGDCYLCQFTHRVVRNFNDPSAPYNDEIVDENSWKDNYDPDDSENNININTGDVNAVPLGMWLTFRVRSSNNLNVRTLDGSDVNDTAMCGHPKGYYPYYPMSTEGTYKHPDSGIYNKGFAKSLSERWNVEVPDVPHIKNWFGTRIMYSDVHVNDAFKNGFRVFLGNNYRDYTREYGEIVKLVSLESNLLIIFEHGIGLATVNERAVAAQGAGGNVYINSSNVLPENLFIISDMFGSLWAESVLKVPGKTGSSALWVYGVDTVAKKIWRTNGLTLECISDMRVQEFLNNNITLGERELTPKIGIRNVKTVYNAFKRDVLFTFYDNTYGFEEKVWNLCWNEILEKFITFYSWVPSYMENINNIPFSFNRDVSKWVAKLGTSHTNSSIADGITLSNVLVNDKTELRDYGNGTIELAVDNFAFPFTYINKEGKYVTKTYNVATNSRHRFIGVLQLTNRTLPDDLMFYYTEFSIERDNYLNHERFEVLPINVEELYGLYLHTDGNTYYGITLPDDAKFAGHVVPIFALKFKGSLNNSTVSDELEEVYYKDNVDLVDYTAFCSNYFDLNDPSTLPNHYVYIKNQKCLVESMLTELYYRNSAGNAYADYDTHKIGTKDLLKNTVVGVWYGGRIVNGRTIIYSDREESESIEDYKLSIIDYIDLVEREFPNTVVGNSTNHNSSSVTVVNNLAYAESSTNSINPCTTTSEIKSKLTWRNDKPYVHGIRLNLHWTESIDNMKTIYNVHYGLPIFKDITGKRKMLPKDELLNPDKIVTLLNIKANIYIEDSVNAQSLSDYVYQQSKAKFAKGSSLIDAGYYESVVAIMPKWNLLFLGSDFWKHGQAGIIDIADDLYPTYWYGKQHPFEFECVVVNDPGIHKIFTNLELVANKAKPESFHYEIVGEVYDFAKEKKNMYFRQEALKALWLYNGADICYDRNFLKVQPELYVKSADFPHKYYTRQDTINDIEDYYVGFTAIGYDYRHLSGSEIVYYPNRQEYRIWTHAKAVDIDDLSLDDARSIIAANCHYLEDRWRISINPIVVCYKNESRWLSANRPKLPVLNSPIPNRAFENIKNRDGLVDIPEVLTDLGYSSNDIDTSNWLGLYSENRKETDIRDKFVKVRIRYSGEELAVIDFLNTIYRVSYA